MKKDLKELLNELPINIEGIIRLHGIELDKNAELPADLSGEIRRVEDCKYKISTQKNDHYYRKRFTMAHELGHYLFHRDKIGDGVSDTPAYRTSGSGDLVNEKITAEHEAEANVFAASTLMPEDAIKYYLTEKKSLKDMSVIFQMSEKALETRVKSLKLSQ